MAGASSSTTAKLFPQRFMSIRTRCSMLCSTVVEEMRSSRACATGSFKWWHISRSQQISLMYPATADVRSSKPSNAARASGLNDSHCRCTVRNKARRAGSAQAWQTSPQARRSGSRSPPMYEMMWTMSSCGKGGTVIWGWASAAAHDCLCSFIALAADTAFTP
jgi:hypothetical protein